MAEINQIRVPALPVREPTIDRSAGMKKAALGQAIEGLGNVAAQGYKEVVTDKLASDLYNLTDETRLVTQQENTETPVPTVEDKTAGEQTILSIYGDRVKRLAAMQRAGLSENYVEMQAEALLTKYLRRHSSLAPELIQTARQVLGTSPLGASRVAQQNAFKSQQEVLAAHLKQVNDVLTANSVYIPLDPYDENFNAYYGIAMQYFEAFAARDQDYKLLVFENQNTDELQKKLFTSISTGSGAPLFTGDDGKVYTGGDIQSAATADAIGTIHTIYGEIAGGAGALLPEEGRAIATRDLTAEIHRARDTFILNWQKKTGLTQEQVKTAFATQVALFDTYLTDYGPEGYLAALKMSTDTIAAQFWNDNPNLVQAAELLNLVGRVGGDFVSRMHLSNTARVLTDTIEGLVVGERPNDARKNGGNIPQGAIATITSNFQRMVQKDPNAAVDGLFVTMNSYIPAGQNPGDDVGFLLINGLRELAAGELAPKDRFKAFDRSITLASGMDWSEVSPTQGTNIGGTVMDTMLKTYRALSEEQAKKLFKDNLYNETIRNGVRLGSPNGVSGPTSNLIPVPLEKLIVLDPAAVEQGRVLFMKSPEADSIMAGATDQVRNWWNRNWRELVRQRQDLSAPQQKVIDYIRSLPAISEEIKRMELAVGIAYMMGYDELAAQYQARISNSRKD